MKLNYDRGQWWMSTKPAVLTERSVWEDQATRARGEEDRLERRGRQGVRTEEDEEEGSKAHV